MTRQAITYGAIVAAALFFVGWITGLGGSFGPNIGFSVLMGLFATGGYIFAHRMRSAGSTETDRNGADE